MLSNSTINRVLYKNFVKIIGLSKDNTTRNLYYLFRVALFACIAVLAIDIISIYLDNSATFGTFGDFLGGVLNPILTFLMFMGLLITIIIQQKEFKLARQESVRSANALEHAHNEMKKQTAVLSYNHQKNDILNFLERTQETIEKLLYSEIFAMPTMGMREEIARTKTNLDKIKKSYSVITTPGYSPGGMNIIVPLDLEKITTHVKIYYSLVIELEKLNTNNIVLTHYLLQYKDELEFFCSKKLISKKYYEEVDKISQAICN